MNHVPGRHCTASISTEGLKLFANVVEHLTGLYSIIVAGLGDEWLELRQAIWKMPPAGGVVDRGAAQAVEAAVSPPGPWTEKTHDGDPEPGYPALEVGGCKSPVRRLLADVRSPSGTLRWVAEFQQSPGPFWRCVLISVEHVTASRLLRHALFFLCENYSCCIHVIFTRPSREEIGHSKGVRSVRRRLRRLPTLRLIGRKLY